VCRITVEGLLRYDLNIVNYWQQIARKRNRLEAMSERATVKMTTDEIMALTRGEQ
jgi:hypothetical protein